MDSSCEWILDWHHIDPPRITLKCHMCAEMDTTWYNWHYLGLPYSFNKMCSWNLTWILIHNHSERNLIEGSVPKTLFHIKFQFGKHAQHHVWNQIPLQTKSQITSAAILVSAMRSTVKQPRTKVSLKISFHTYFVNSTCLKYSSMLGANSLKPIICRTWTCFCLGGINYSPRKRIQTLMLFSG